jgi:hypothetical protein
MEFFVVQAGDTPREFNGTYSIEGGVLSITEDGSTEPTVIYGPAGWLRVGPGHPESHVPFAIRR